MNQDELQNELDRIAWSGKAYHLPEKVTLTGPEPLRIHGCYLVGWNEYAPAHIAARLATIEVLQNVAPAIEVKGNHAGLGRHVFHYPNQSRHGRPSPYPPTIHASGGNVALFSMSFFGAWSFIDIEGGGQNTIYDIRGQLLGGVGIGAKDCRDVLTVDKIHLWPFFSLDSELMKWAYHNPGREGNARGIVLGEHVDWPQLDNIFVYGAHVGLQIAGPCDPQIGNAAFDACSVGLDIYNIGQGGLQIANLRVAGNRSHGAWKCIPILGRREIDRPVQIGNMHLHGDTAENIWEADRDLLQIGNFHKA